MKSSFLTSILLTVCKNIRGIALLSLILMPLLGLTAGCVPYELEDILASPEITSEVAPTHSAVVPTASPIPPTSTPLPAPSATSTNVPVVVPDAVVKATSLNVYDGPSLFNDRMGSLVLGQELKITGQYDNCAWLKGSTADGSEGWVNADPADLEFNLECSEVPIGTYRPVNGTILNDQRGNTANFLGELEVDNGTADDGLVVITQMDGSVVIAFYVRAKSSFTLTGIPDDNYWVYVANGQGWDESTHQMATVLSYERFEDTFPYETDATSYTIWSITLHPVPEGQADTEPVDQADFPELGGS